MNYKDINGKKHELRENSILTIKEYYGYELKNPHTTMMTGGFTTKDNETNYRECLKNKEFYIDTNMVEMTVFLAAQEKVKSNPIQEKYIIDFEFKNEYSYQKAVLIEKRNYEKIMKSIECRVEIPNDTIRNEDNYKYYFNSTRVMKFIFDKWKDELGKKSFSWKGKCITENSFKEEKLLGRGIEYSVNGDEVSKEIYEQIKNIYEEV